MEDLNFFCIAIQKKLSKWPDGQSSDLRIFYAFADAPASTLKIEHRPERYGREYGIKKTSRKKGDTTMALHWDFKERIGEATFVTYPENSEPLAETIYLYEGNAFLIMVAEWEDEQSGEGLYTLHSFWADEQHAKNCLGLKKKEGYENNIYVNDYQKLVSIKLNKAKSRNFKKIVSLMAQAFDDLVIVIENK